MVELCIKNLSYVAKTVRKFCASCSTAFMGSHAEKMSYEMTHWGLDSTCPWSLCHVTTEIFDQKQHDHCPHHQYSQHLVPCDQFVFPKLKSVYKGKRLNTFTIQNKSGVQRLNSQPTFLSHIINCKYK
jgi:hypothetical protein